MAAVGGHIYPRPDGRGPIEATMNSSGMVQTARLRRTIRDLTVAAPLKLHPELALYWPTQSGAYPRPDGRGPIEASP